MTLKALTALRNALHLTAEEHLMFWQNPSLGFREGGMQHCGH